MGEFECQGRPYQGTHKPLVSRELWERVQRVLDLRQAKKRRRSKHDFAFAGLLECERCRCAVVGEIKKQRYVYYHCSRARCLREIEQHQAADRSYLEEGIRVLELAESAKRLFLQQSSREKRRLLECLVSNSTWRGGKLTATLRQPFDLAAKTTALAARSAARDKSE